MFEHMVDQNTDQWQSLRCGKITASAFDVLMPAKSGVSKFSQGQRTYLIGVASEILTNRWEDIYQNAAMRQGHEREPLARVALSEALDIPIRESGFWEYSKYIGVSPDGIGGFEEFTAELKCPQPKAHMLYLLDLDEFLKKYQWQVKGQMWATGIHQAYYGSYNPDFPKDRSLTYGYLELSKSEIDLFENRTGYAVELLKEWTGDKPIDIELSK